MKRMRSKNSIHECNNKGRKDYIRPLRSLKGVRNEVGVGCLDYTT